MAAEVVQMSAQCVVEDGRNPRGVLARPRSLLVVSDEMGSVDVEIDGFSQEYAAVDEEPCMSLMAPSLREVS